MEEWETNRRHTGEFGETKGRQGGRHDYNNRGYTFTGFEYTEVYFLGLEIYII